MGRRAPDRPKRLEARLLRGPRPAPAPKLLGPRNPNTIQLVRFADLAGNLDQMEATSSRNELVRITSEVYRASSVDELGPITYLIQGRLAPFFEPVEIGLGERLLMTAIAGAYSVPKEEVTKLNRQTGDLGVTVQRLAPVSDRESPSVAEVHQRLYRIAAAGGAGSQQEKLDGFTGLLTDLDSVSAKHLVRITLGKMRLGVGDPTVLDALSFATSGEPCRGPILEAAYNRTSDLGLIARTLWDSGETGLDALKVSAGHPLRPQLAERLPNPEAVIQKLGTVGVQPKHDRLRVQIPQHADEARIL